MDTPLDLVSLGCFLAAARTLNFRAAANAESMSPAAFGQRIANLENDLGVSLFERSTRSVRLTAEGSQALPLAQRLLDQCAEFKAQVAAPGTPQYSLTIATHFELGLSWITPALDELERLRPERLLHLSFGDSDDMIERMRILAVDAAVTSSRRFPKGAQSVTLHQEDYTFVGACSLLDRQPLRNTKEASSHTLLDIDPSLPLFRYFLGAQSSPAHWTFGETRFLGTIAAILQRVQAGHGVAVLPSYFLAGQLEDSKLRSILPSKPLLKDEFRLLWRTDHPHPERLLQLAEDLRGIPLA